MIPKLIIHPLADKRENHIRELITKLGFSLNHPDLMWLGIDEKLNMDQAKKIKNFLKLKPYRAKGQMIAVIAAENLTTEAQNALLKTLEEHAEDVNLILGAGHVEQLLETLVSRCQVINLEHTEEVNTKETEKFYKQIETLIPASIEERFKFMEKLDEKDIFLLSLTKYFRKKLPQKESVNFLKDLLEAQKWAKSNVNIRAILEYLMLKMPKK